MKPRNQETGGTLIETSLVLTLVILIAFPALSPLGLFVGEYTCNIYEKAEVDHEVDDKKPWNDLDMSWDPDLKKCLPQAVPQEDPELPLDGCIFFPDLCSG